ncbi:MAG: acyl-CoA dehydrogenase family protein [Hyphomicrobiaceae bacterium]|nr:acyl-CoA dehydrogenase family protein [Hyphomicrobiaceae bacterium]
MMFDMTEEQALIVETVRRFLVAEIYPHEAEVDRAGEVPTELASRIKQRSLELGLFTINMPESVGGPGLDPLTLVLVEREFGKASWSLTGHAGRRTRLLLACQDGQIERYLKPALRGERKDCFALTEPEAGSDMMAMRTRAVRQSDGTYILNGNKHFISSASCPDFALVFAVTGEDETSRGPRKRITTFLVDAGTPGFTIERGPRATSHRAYPNWRLTFADCHVGADQVLGEEGQGLELANRWLDGGRLGVAASCCGRAERVLDLALDWAATRKQFGQTIGRFQAVSFKLADMAMHLRAADALVFQTAIKLQHGSMTAADAAAVKVFASEMLGMVTDHAVQIFGGAGLVEDMPIERFWRDARIERIWDGTSEMQRHILSRELLRPREAMAR